MATNMGIYILQRGYLVEMFAFEYFCISYFSGSALKSDRYRGGDGGRGTPMWPDS